MREDYLENGQNFFHYGDELCYLSQSSNEMITGIKVSLQDIRYTLRDYDSEGSYDYFFVNALTKELLDSEESISDIGREIYAGMDWDRKSAQEIKIGRQRYLVDRIGKDANGFLILIYMDKSEAYDNIYAMYKVWGGATLLLLLVPVVLGLRVRRIINRPMEKLQKAMQMVERENYSYLLAMDESREFNYVFAQYNQMTEKVRNLIQEVLEKQVQVEQARYKQLQTQINPHFLFNSLYMGYRLAQAENCEAVGDLCMYLGDYFSVLTFVSNESISMEYELKFVNTYLCLNQMRF
ncbi:MAG: histidine kinase, partial [Acetatifactor sp.]|nr:histidine kinase [Acetatifactor sp.]